MTETKDTAVCKGSYALGTACGKCERCWAEQRAAWSEGFAFFPGEVIGTTEADEAMRTDYPHYKRALLGDAPSVDHDLAEALREAQKREMTHRERWLQRVSFAYGNAALANPAVTYEQVRAAAEELYGPCPEEEEEER